MGGNNYGFILRNYADGRGVLAQASANNGPAVNSSLAQHAGKGR
jgi:hypothetical protein